MRLRANWWLNANAVKKEIGVKTRLDKYADFQSLKKFPFGELGYDYEEGLVFETTDKKLPALVDFIRKFHNERSIPFTAPKIGPLFSVNSCDSRDWDKFPAVAKKCKLELSEDYKFVANLK